MGVFKAIDQAIEEKFPNKEKQDELSEEAFSYRQCNRCKDYAHLGEDNEDEATRFGYPSWWTLNFAANYELNSMLSLNFAIENVLDQFYKPFASGVSAPGRNFSITLRIIS